MHHNVSAIASYKRLISCLRPYRWIFVSGILGIIMYALSDALFVRSLKPLIDKGFVKRDAAFIAGIPLFVLGMFLIRGIGSFLSKYCMGKVGRSIVRDLRREMLTHLMRVPSCFFDKHTSGELISKINYDTEQVADAITEAICATITGFAITCALLYVMFSINWRITTLLTLVLPVMAFYIHKVSQKMRAYSTQVQATMGSITQVSEEVVEGNRVIRTFGGIDYESHRIAQVTTDNYKKEMQMIRVTALSVPVMQMMAAIAMGGLFFLAMHGEVGQGGFSMSAGDFTAMCTAMLQLMRPIKQIGIVNSTLQRGISGAQSIFRLLDESTEIDKGHISLDRAAGKMVFSDVSFSYESNTHKSEGMAILERISFTVPAGETVAFVGRSGSGKSTIAALLPRFYEIDSGLISLDGHDCRDIKLKDLRKQFAIVSQQVILFNDTIENNIAYGCADKVTPQQILKAAELAHVMEFVDSMPQGLKTMIGDNGVRLSGGQRQRIAIARAFLKDAPILILDEATSALDMESEYSIQNALEKLMKNRTTIIIAHRLSTIVNANLILVLEQGRIVERGTHQTLLQKNGRYAQLQHSQLHHQLEPNMA
jgi:subfamily B ATP-binding cassette protein MsbA